jgi:hypothetical protein
VRLKITIRVEITFERDVITLVSVIFTRIRVKITFVVCGNHSLRVKSHSACGNRTLREYINLVRLDITLCVWKSYSACCNPISACLNHTREWHNHNSCGKLHSAYIIHTLACRYHTRECHIHTHTCQNYSRVNGNHTLRVKSHSAFGNRTLRVEIYLVRVEINLVRVEITFVLVKISLRVEITLCE